jgi:hypothetical protein
MSKNLNGITMQIDAILIVYLILQCLRHGYAYRAPLLIDFLMDL